METEIEKTKDNFTKNNTNKAISFKNEMAFVIILYTDFMRYSIAFSMYKKHQKLIGTVIEYCTLSQ